MLNNVILESDSLNNTFDDVNAFNVLDSNCTNVCYVSNV